MTKDEIRIQQKKLRDGLSKEERESLCEAIWTRLFQTEAYLNCKSIFSYVSFKSEVDTKKIIHHSLFDNKRVYVPRVDGQEMDFYEIHSLEGLIASKFGVPEPPANELFRYMENQIKNQIESQALFDKDSSQYNKMMLLPGLAFDKSGNRIGYGAGYYDRYLIKNLDLHFYKIALAFDFQIVDHITADEYDVKADAILTPTQLILCR